MAPQAPLDFRTSEQRSQWIIANADHYTTFVITNRIKCGDAYKTLEAAEKAAHHAATLLNKPIMIYAVADSGLGAGARSTWVKTIQPGVPDEQGSEGRDSHL